MKTENHEREDSLRLSLASAIVMIAMLVTALVIQILE